jgi:hypothetical protein
MLVHLSLAQFIRNLPICLIRVLFYELEHIVHKDLENKN